MFILITASIGFVGRHYVAFRNIDRVSLSNSIQPVAKLSPPTGPHAAESLGETLKEKRHSS